MGCLCFSKTYLVPLFERHHVRPEMDRDTTIPGSGKSRLVRRIYSSRIQEVICSLCMMVLINFYGITDMTRHKYVIAPVLSFAVGSCVEKGHQMSTKPKRRHRGGSVHKPLVTQGPPKDHALVGRLVDRTFAFLFTPPFGSLTL